MRGESLDTPANARSSPVPRIDRPRLAHRLRKHDRREARFLLQRCCRDGKGDRCREGICCSERDRGGGTEEGRLRLVRHARAARGSVLAFALLGAIAGCKRAPSSATSPPDPMLRALRSFEAGLRAGGTDRPPGLGPDPYALAVVGGRVVGLLRGVSAVVVLDQGLGEVARADAGPMADALAVSPDGSILVGSEASGVLRRFVVTEREGRVVIEERPSIDSGATSVRALSVYASGAIYAADEAADAVFFTRPGAAPERWPVARGPIRLALTAHHLAVVSLIGHALTVVELADDGASLGAPIVVRHDGPFWGVAARERDGVLEIAAGGVEDHPLDRSGGSFGFVDSFLFLYRVKGGVLEETARENVGERGVVLPKALAFRSDGTLAIAGYGSDSWVGVRDGFGGGPAHFETHHAYAGIASMIEGPDRKLVAADPLLDVWLAETPNGFRASPVPGPPRDPVSRLGKRSSSRRSCHRGRRPMARSVASRARHVTSKA